MNSPNTIRYN